MVGSVIQAPRKVEFEDGLWIEKLLKAQYGLHQGSLSYLRFYQVQCAHQILNFLQGEIEFQYAEVYEAAWF